MLRCNLCQARDCMYQGMLVRAAEPTNAIEWRNNIPAEVCISDLAGAPPVGSPCGAAVQLCSCACAVLVCIYKCTLTHALAAMWQCVVGAVPCRRQTSRPAFCQCLGLLTMDGASAGVSSCGAHTCCSFTKNLVAVPNIMLPLRQIAIPCNRSAMIRKNGGLLQLLPEMNTKTAFVLLMLYTPWCKFFPTLVDRQAPPVCSPFPVLRCALIRLMAALLYTHQVLRIIHKDTGVLSTGHSM